MRFRNGAGGQWNSDIFSNICAEKFFLCRCFGEFSFSVVKYKLIMQSRILREAVHADCYFTLLLLVHFKQQY